MSNNNRPVINYANPSFLVTICEALRVKFAAQYGMRNTEWTAYFVAGDCASVKDEFGGCWDIDLTNKQIISHKVMDGAMRRRLANRLSRRSIHRLVGRWVDVGNTTNQPKK